MSSRREITSSRSGASCLVPGSSVSSIDLLSFVFLYLAPVDCPRRRLTNFSEGGDEMNGLKIMAIVLIAVGIGVLLYGKFSYTKETHDLKLGPLEMTIKEKQTVNVPVWAGVAAIVAGGGLLLYASKKR
jgi:hypothetical protein